MKRTEHYGHLFNDIPGKIQCGYLPRYSSDIVYWLALIWRFKPVSSQLNPDRAYLIKRGMEAVHGIKMDSVRLKRCLL
ncbi:MAG: hypothetical protein ACTSP4_01205 [Candidatus Hodarchaeales archaeon]